MTLRHFIFCALFHLCASFSVLALNIQPSSLYEFQLPVPATLGDKILGRAFSTSKSTVAIAARPKSNLLTGSVYIYDVADNWRLINELQSEYSADNFSKDIILDSDNDRLIITADHDDTLGVDSGTVYIFKLDKTVTPPPNGNQ